MEQKYNNQGDEMMVEEKISTCDSVKYWLQLTGQTHNTITFVILK